MLLGEMNLSARDVETAVVERWNGQHDRVSLGCFEGCDGSVVVTCGLTAIRERRGGMIATPL